MRKTTLLGFLFGALAVLGLANVVTAHGAPAAPACRTPQDVIAVTKKMPGFESARVFAPAEVAALVKQATIDAPGQVVAGYDTIAVAYFGDYAFVFGGRGGKLCEFFAADAGKLRAFITRVLGTNS